MMVEMVIKDGGVMVVLCVGVDKQYVPEQVFFKD